MKLTRLRLHGFKSFVEPTDFMIEPGLTGVVGPNGCGKSNLVEALRWAMGETSHKSLRAADMDAVIFAGSGNRPSRNHAEVVMTIDNSDRSAPAAVNDREILEISRRIEREAGSVYRINGRDVRARDVQILFADAATGARSPALVHQGKIGEIIQAKPEQRRRVLEDAAGVAGLHARRHEAELRLRAAETNLTRVEDVVGQLAGQIDGLKKQARQAIRYREVAAKVRKAEAMLFHLRWLEANADVAEAAHTHDLSVREMAERTREQAEAARIQAIRASELPALREGEARAAAGLQRLTNARETLDREEERAKERVAELDRRLTQFSADIAREQQQTSDAEVALQRLDTEDTELKEEIKSRVEKRSGVDERVSEAEATLAAAERLFAELTTVLADLTAKRNQLEANVRTHRDRLARLDQEIANVQADEQKLARKPAGSATSTRSPRRMETAQQTLAESEAAAQASEAGHVAARQKLEASRAPLNEADKRVQRLETEARTISKLVNSETKNLWPPIIDGVTVAKGYEKAIGAGARRRSRRAGRSVGADALDQCRCRARRSGAARRRRAACRPCRCAGRAGAPPRADRRRAEGARRGTGVAVEDRPAAGVAGRRRLALGRFCRRGPRADRRGAAARRARPPGRYRERAGAGPHRRRRQAAGAGRRRGRTEGGLRRRSRRPRSLARRAARGRCRARAPCHDRARDQPPRRAQIGADRSPYPPRRRPQRGRSRA